MNVKKQLVLIRSELNMSQEDLARKLNVSFATINRWETGRTKPSRRYIATIEAFCKKNNIKVEWDNETL